MSRISNAARKPAAEIDDTIAMIAAAGEFLMPTARAATGAGGSAELPTAWDTLPGWRASDGDSA